MPPRVDRDARADFNRTMIADFWKIWKRFHETNVTLAIEPGHEAWAVFRDTFPDGPWTWRPGFDAGAVTTIGLVDRAAEQGRVGDALRVVHDDRDGAERVRITFEYCQGEAYRKSSGWRRIWSIHTLFDSSRESADFGAIGDLLADAGKVWLDSHLRRNRDVLIRHLRKTYPDAETFST